MRELIWLTWWRPVLVVCLVGSLVSCANDSGVGLSGSSSCKSFLGASESDRARLVQSLFVQAHPGASATGPETANALLNVEYECGQDPSVSVQSLGDFRPYDTSNVTNSLSGGQSVPPSTPTQTPGTGMTFKIGFEGPISGNYAQVGTEESNGASLAIDQANQSGKYAFAFELTRSDDVGSTDYATQAAATLINDPGVLAVVGPAYSTVTAKVAPRYARAQLPFVTPSATSPTLSANSNTFFHRVVANDDQVAAQAAAWIARRNPNNVLVANDGEAYYSAQESPMLRRLVQSGIRANTVAGSPSRIAARASGTNALVYFGDPTSTASLARALHSSGWHGLIVGGPDVVEAPTQFQPGAAANGWFFVCGCFDARSNVEFSTAYRAAYSSPPSALAASGFDAAKVIINAVSRAAANGVPTRASVESSLAATDLRGITARIRFKANGDLYDSAGVDLYRWTNGNISMIGDIALQG